MASPGAVLVEGHGELGAVDNLVARLCTDEGPRWLRASRWNSLSSAAGRRSAVEAHRNRPIGGMLVLRDEDDACPRDNWTGGRARAR